MFAKCLTPHEIAVPVAAELLAWTATITTSMAAMLVIFSDWTGLQGLERDAGGQSERNKTLFI